MLFEGTLAGHGDTLVGTWQGMGESVTNQTYLRATKDETWVVDSSVHTTHFVTVENGVHLEVLDWGGEGPPLVFLAGLGNTAHVFDNVAPNFTDSHRVFGITRRGFGASSVPPPTDENYDADKLGDDILAVIDVLDLQQPPVLVGHSIAGQELSSIGTRYLGKVAALIYLDATFAEAFYDPSQVWDVWVDSALVRRALSELVYAGPSQARAIVGELQILLPHLTESLEYELPLYDGLPDRPVPRETLQRKIQKAIIQNTRRYFDIKTPVLVIAAFPHHCSEECDSTHVLARETKWAAQLEAIEAGLPHARVVRIPNADHYIFRSNEARVLREIDAFLEDLYKSVSTQEN